MWSLRKKLEIPGPEQCLPGRAIKMRVPDQHFVNGHRLDGPYPAGLEEAVMAFTSRPGGSERAGYFAFAMDDPRPAARRLERIVAWRCRTLALPYGDQGLLIARSLYDAVGGFAPIPLMEDVDFVRRLGRYRLMPIAAPIICSARRYRREGYLRRPLRNLLCLSLYFAGVPPQRVARFYD